MDHGMSSCTSKKQTKYIKTNKHLPFSKLQLYLKKLKINDLISKIGPNSKNALL